MTAKFDSDWDGDAQGETPETAPAETDSENDSPEFTPTVPAAEAEPESGFAESDFQEGNSKEPSQESNRRTLSDPEIEHYRKELDEDLRLTHADGAIDLTAFKTKTFMEAANRGKWLSYLTKEKEVLAKLSKKTAEFTDAVTKKLMSGTGSGFEKRQKVEEFMKGNPAMAKLREASAMQQRKIDFLIEANEIMSKFGYSIRNGLDYLKLQF